MPTRLQHIYAIQNEYHRGPKPDDAQYPSDRLVAHLLNTMRATLLKQKQDRHQVISPMSYQTICIPLELTNYEDCNCLEADVQPLLDDCKILKSKCPLPTEVTSKWGSSLHIKYLDGTHVPETNLTSNKYSAYSLSGANNKEGWFIGDNAYLYVVNSKLLQVVLGRALWQSPESLDGYCDCNDITLGPTNGSATCHDSLTEEYPIDGELVRPLYDLVMLRLKESMQYPVDNMNDGRTVENLNAIDPNERN